MRPTAALARLAVALVAVALLVPTAGCSDPPSGFGVNLELSIKPLGSDQSRVSVVWLHVDGAEMFDSNLTPSQFSSGVARGRYVPGVRSGDLDLHRTALDSAGGGLGGGNVTVTLGAGAMPAK